MRTSFVFLVETMEVAWLQIGPSLACPMMSGRNCAAYKTLPVITLAAMLVSTSPKRLNLVETT